MAETGLGCLSKGRAEGFQQRREAELVQVPFQLLSAALCSPFFLEPSCFQGGWLIADGECFVLFLPSLGLGWAKCEVMKLGWGTRAGTGILARAGLGICV